MSVSCSPGSFGSVVECAPLSHRLGRHEPIGGGLLAAGRTENTRLQQMLSDPVQQLHGCLVEPWLDDGVCVVVTPI